VPPDFAVDDEVLVDFDELDELPQAPSRTAEAITAIAVRAEVLYLLTRPPRNFDAPRPTI